MRAEAIARFRPDIDFGGPFQDLGEVSVQSVHQFGGPLDIGLLDNVHAVFTHLR